MQILIRLQGGLGNQLFQYAFGRMLGSLYSRPVRFDLSFLLDRTPRPNFTYRTYDLEILACPVELVYLAPESFSRMAVINESGLGFNSPLLEELSKYNWEVPLYFNGYWQNYKYAVAAAKEYLPSVVVLEQPQEARFLELEHHLKEVQAVCVHFRRGDYVTDSVTNKYHGVQGMEYINSAVELLSPKLEKPEFFIFSDDVKWCQENVRMEYPYHIIPQELAGRKAGLHFRLMQACKHFIISNSSFSWWAAWTAFSARPDTMVVAPKNWFQGTTLDTTELTPPQWHRI